MTLLYMFLDANIPVEQTGDLIKYATAGGGGGAIAMGLNKVLSYLITKDKNEAASKQRTEENKKFEKLEGTIEAHIKEHIVEDKKRHDSELERIIVTTEMSKDIKYLIEEVKKLNIKQ